MRIRRQLDRHLVAKRQAVKSWVRIDVNQEIRVQRQAAVFLSSLIELLVDGRRDVVRRF